MFISGFFSECTWKQHDIVKQPAGACVGYQRRAGEASWMEATRRSGADRSKHTQERAVRLNTRRICLETLLEAHVWQRRCRNPALTSEQQHNGRLYQHMCHWKSTAALDLDPGSSNTYWSIGKVRPPTSILSRLLIRHVPATYVKNQKTNNETKKNPVTSVSTYQTIQPWRFCRYTHCNN